MSSVVGAEGCGTFKKWQLDRGQNGKYRSHVHAFPCFDLAHNLSFTCFLSHYLYLSLSTTYLLCTPRNVQTSNQLHHTRYISILVRPKSILFLRPLAHTSLSLRAIDTSNGVSTLILKRRRQQTTGLHRFATETTASVLLVFAYSIPSQLDALESVDGLRAWNYACCVAILVYSDLSSTSWL